MPTALVGDLRTHYVDEGTGRPLLLVHGFPLDHSMWRGQIDRLSGNCRVIAPDLRGFGHTDVTLETVTMERFADDLAALLDVLSVREPIVFCGLSMGGYIAWQFWKRHSKRLAALVLCDTRAAPDTPEMARGRLVTAEQVLSEGPQGLVDKLIEKLFSKDTVHCQPTVVSTTRQVMLGTSPAGIAAALRGMAARPDMTGELARIDVPALVLCGEQDVISPAAEMRDMAKAMRFSRFVEIPRSGHMSPLEQPNLINVELEKLLNSL